MQAILFSVCLSSESPSLIAGDPKEMRRQAPNPYPDFLWRAPRQQRPLALTLVAVPCLKRAEQVGARTSLTAPWPQGGSAIFTRSVCIVASGRCALLGQGEEHPS
eukprot:TRINITY_DN15493_c0_g1_i2.p1 TRINITY_DN15493_c0_g1~~TRINITY_DN15493_c0_g1_i2.p1  ORF type:complete len:120 (-),score=8.62 TRINITY_DN15493_c0_g1_i2:38-352(-)